MLIISDCLKNDLDEGCIKIASTLSKMLQKRGATLISINCDCDYADENIMVNSAFSSKILYEKINKYEGNILYIPFASNTLGTAIRILNLSRRSGREINVLFTLRWEMNILTKFLLSISRCNVFTLSEESERFFKTNLSNNQVINFKTGVDISKFKPVSKEQKEILREKYNIPKDKKVLLHVGHLKHSRNIDTFLNVSNDYFVVLVFSNTTNKDEVLREKLQAKENIKIIEDYVSNIEEIYQAADVYVFPICVANNSIDIPLSVLEAAACNINIIATPFKEIKFFKKADGFKLVENDEINQLDDILNKISFDENINTRSIAEEYDWNKSIENISYAVKLQ